jgi:uncharacterized protein YutE (UPF0331/DUF86 family)
MSIILILLNIIIPFISVSGIKMKFNIDLIKRRVSEIKNSIEGLESLALLEKDKFLSDSNARDAAKYKLLLAIEASLSICNHINAKISKKVPETYADCFIILGDSGIISSELAEHLAKMAKFRNILIHVYWEIDDSKVYDIINQDLNDLRMYINELKIFLGKEI